MCFAGGATEYAIANYSGATIEHPCLVSGFQAIAKNTGGPGKFVGTLFNGINRFDIGLLHGPHLRCTGNLRVHVRT